MPIIRSNKAIWFILGPSIFFVILFLINSILQFILRSGFGNDETLSFTIRNISVFLSIIAVIWAVPSIVYGGILLNRDYRNASNNFYFEGKEPSKNWFLFQLLSNGRITRLSYILLHALVVFILLFILLILPFLWFSENVSFVIIGIHSLFTIYILLLLRIKRFHDLDMSGWHVLLSFIPIVNIYFWVLLLFVKWNQGDNRFGKNIYNKSVQS